MNRAWDALALLACVVALAVGLRTVHGLPWPPDEDHFRDVAAAQTALDGKPLGDPYYAGESIWYNPLAPWLVAAGAAATGLPPAFVHVRGAPWLNLLVPIAFYLFAARVAGRGAATIALVAFIFWNGGRDVMASPTYVPWLWVGNFSQAFLYLGLLAIVHCAERPTWKRASAVGLLAGVALLAHTAAALVLAVAAAVSLRPRLLALAGAIAVVVASPFLYSIIGRYGLQVVNDAPLTWSYPLLSPGRLLEPLRTNALLIVLGVVGVARLRHPVARASLLASVTLLVYGLMRHVLPSLPPLLPAFHFWRFTLGVLTVFAASAVWQLVGRLGERRACAAVALVAIAAVWLALPGYRQRDDFIVLREIAIRRHPREAVLTAALRGATRPGDVVLGPELVGLQVIGPAGRKTVAVGAIWSNPYVAYEPRRRDLEGMLSRLRDRDEYGFLELAARYGVSHVIGIGGADCDRFDAWPLTRVARAADSCIFRVASPGPNLRPRQRAGS